MKSKIILVTGGTGYVGGRLVPLLLERGYRVRAVARSLEKLKSRPWTRLPHVDLVAVDLLDLDSLRKAVAGCGVAYYLVHSMLSRPKNFESADRKAAANMVQAAEEAGLERIIYLGGLGDAGSDLSHHLRSRAEVARVLKAGKVPVTVLRAAMIIGSGSTSFEIVRYLVDRLPVMVIPKWLETPSQPIAIRNVLNYLTGCLECPATTDQTYDVGGPDVVDYRKLMEIYAEEAGLPKRRFIAIPFLTTRLSSYWIHFVTPVPASMARALAEGLRNPVICRDLRIREILPQELLDCRTAMRLALQRIEEDRVKTHWSDAGEIPPVEMLYPGDPQWAGGTIFEDKRSVKVHAPSKKVWYVIKTIGGTTGWYHADRLWKFRGFLDRLVGGVGLRRGRRSVREIRSGDALDFWRVGHVTEGSHLFLIAEMKLPGRATLEFQIERNSEDPGSCMLYQIARFIPKGLFGILYWYCVLPFHAYIFGGMLQGIARAAEAKKRPENADAE
ncbi:MAG: SDR family oxidoreductase [Candidatus Omnitrophota bacterium]